MQVNVLPRESIDAMTGEAIAAPLVTLLRSELDPELISRALCGVVAALPNSGDCSRLVLSMVHNTTQTTTLIKWLELYWSAPWMVMYGFGTMLLT